MNPSGFKGNGSLGQCVIISITTQCRETRYVLLVFGWRYAVYGGNRSSVAASAIGFNGYATGALSTSTYLAPEMHIFTLRIASRYIPEAEPYAVAKYLRICAGGR